MPPLRERRDDIGRLLLHFLRQELQRVGEEHRLDIDSTACDPLWLPPRLVSQLARYDWPGNVRQLRNVVRQLVIGSRGLPRLEIGPQVARLLQERYDPVAESPAPSSASGGATAGNSRLAGCSSSLCSKSNARSMTLRSSRTFPAHL